MLPITEKFASIQGENFEAGTPSIFIRVGGCPLVCPWCDSKYASREGFKAKFELNTPTDVSDFVRLVATAPKDEIPISHAVITGGEPMMEEYIPHVQQIIFELWTMYHIDTTIETTTCMSPDDIVNPKRSMLTNIEEFLVTFMDKYNWDEIPQFIKFSVSPKFEAECYDIDFKKHPSFGGIFDFYRLNKNCLKLDKLSIINLIYMKIIYKRITWIEDIIISVAKMWPPSLRNKRICIMPYTPMDPSEWKNWKSNTFQEAWRRSCQQTALFCKQSNLRYSPRLHIDLWGLKRGV